MSTHWTYVAIAWGLAGAVFLALSTMSVTRYRRAKRLLSRLETRR
ncbi:heme exporter protein CcmD [Roseococcus pinisoli]|uniref:Heme exporter protein D n=1 Tax=Roseococcus pinisoli TaxID=2835040 RepID=A0ABS5QAD8_9PROT|nr:heme exporter protein CcmD [Roseococcus pinisoli]MBS7809887.1 heme exporter protein CcmD [Roseococcus pinisoli]